MAELGLVRWNDHDEHPYTKTSDCSAGVEIAQILRASLEASAEYEDQRAHENGLLPSKPIADRSSESSTKKCPSGEYTYNSTQFICRWTEDQGEILRVDGSGDDLSAISELFQVGDLSSKHTPKSYP